MKPLVIALFLALSLPLTAAGQPSVEEFEQQVASLNQCRLQICTTLVLSRIFNSASGGAVTLFFSHVDPNGVPIIIPGVAAGSIEIPDGAFLLDRGASRARLLLAPISLEWRVSDELESESEASTTTTRRNPDGSFTRTRTRERDHARTAEIVGSIGALGIDTATVTDAEGFAIGQIFTSERRTVERELGRRFFPF